LAYQQLIEFDADFFGVLRVERVLRVDERADTALFLRLGDGVEAKRGFESRPMEPEGTTSTSTRGCAPSIMMASSPNFVFIARIAASIAALSLASRAPTVFEQLLSSLF